MTQALLLLKAEIERDDPRLRAALESFDYHGIGLTIESPQSPDDATRLVARHAQTVDRIIVAGGDGSMNMAAPALLKVDLPVGLLPWGTANDLARSLAVPENVPDACAIIAHEHPRRIDVGEVNGQYFFNVAHIGLAARVARQSDGAVKKYLGPLAYFLAAWQAFRARRSFRATIDCEGVMETRRVVQISVGNGRFYGGGTLISEDAVIDNGLLDLVALPHVSGARLMALVPALRAGKAGEARDVLMLRGAEINVHTRKPRTITADGEKAGKTPGRFRVLSGALTVYAPTS
jgi:YegS/Rv2252/BmrU family lipid kinase